MEAVVVVILAGGLLLVLAAQLAILRRLDEVALRVWKVIRDERRDDQSQAMTALREAAVQRAEPLLVGLRTYHDQLAADLRAQAVDARGRMLRLEKQSVEAGIALDTTSVLLRQARELVDRLSPKEAPVSPVPAQIAAGLGPRPESARPHPPPRRVLPSTLPSAGGEGEGERPSDEITRVAERSKIEAPGKTLASMPAVGGEKKETGGPGPP